jgi:putative FmdB family regulatory protein
MPIYEYRCSGCGFQKEYLQKVSEPPMSVCPSCNKATFAKMLTAAGFHLKGSGWYATDFKSGAKAKPAASESDGKPGAKAESGAAADAKTETKSETKSESKTESKTETKNESGSKAAAPAVN